MLGLGTTVPLLNYLFTGTPGGRDGTPLGAVDFGTDEEDGKHRVWDVLQIAGVRRGLRGTGLNALGEGLVQGKNLNTIAGDAFTDASNSALHPWLGPGVQYIAKASTGKSLGIRGKMEAQQIPEGGAMQYLENLRAATESQNPLVYSLVRPAFQAAGLDQKPVDEEKGYLGGITDTALKSPFGAAGIKDVGPGKNAAEDLADRLSKARFGGAAMTPKDEKKYALRRQPTSKLKDDPAEGEAAIDAAVEAGQLNEREAANIHKKAGSSPLAWNVRSLSAQDAARVYDAATDEQKAELHDAMLKKVLASKDLAPDDQDALLAHLGIEPPKDLEEDREFHRLNTRDREYKEARDKITSSTGAERSQAAAVAREKALSSSDRVTLDRLRGKRRKAAAIKARRSGRSSHRRIRA